jgi:beta-phosphoglucomutase-like phosphatase (HAD superfamily)
MSLPRYQSGAHCVIVYDLDDVLAQSQEFAAEAYAHWFAANLPGLTLDRARKLNIEFFHTHGDSTGGMARHYDKDAAWCQHAHTEIHQSLVTTMHNHISADLPLFEQLTALKQQGHLPAVLTFSQRPYAHKMLSLLGIRELFMPEHILTKECVDGHSKRTGEPYKRLLQRLTHVARSHPHIMVEDQALNLKPAAQLGFGTVLVGPRAGHNLNSYVHARYARVHDFNQALLTGTYRSRYA